MSDAVMIQLIQVLGVAIGAYAAYMTVKLNVRLKENIVKVDLSLKENAVKVDEVKAVLTEKVAEVQVALAENSQTTATTLTMVNGKMGRVLEELAAVRRDLANATGKSAHIEAAVQAEKKAAEHQALEKIVEAQPGDKAEKRGEADSEAETKEGDS